MDKSKQVHTTAAQSAKSDDAKDTTHKTTAAPVDKPDGPKEHVEAIRFLISELRKTSDDNAKASLDKVSHRIDLLEGKPEAVEAEKQRLAQIQEAANVEKARAEKDVKAA